ncbi:kptA [Symbiodinium sp. CCMP2592]|nr:kptA [Symbiodinium sp. CCMP2592]
MFEEFRTTNLQTQSATPLDQRNRDLFQAYLHATLNVSKSEWIAQKLNPCVRALLTRFEHTERGDLVENTVLQDVFAKWRAEKDQLLSPKPTKPMPVTEEDKLWEAPDAADAADITKLAATMDVSSIADCVNDVVTQVADGKVSYDLPGTVALVDEGEYENPIPSTMGRVIEPVAPKPTKKFDRDEDALRKLMFVDESAPQAAAAVPERLSNEYFCNGVKHQMKPFNPEDIVGDKSVCFKHGDLKFLTKLLRGHELDDFPLVFDRGCWTDVDALLQTFNTARGARWGIRQLVRAAKADNKGRIRLLGIDVPMRETIGQPLFPVRIRIAQGHNEKLVGNNPDADFFLEDTPAKLYHRTNERGMNGILRDGMIPGSARSNRAHNYLSPYRLDDTKYKSGMRSNQPVELAVDTQRAINAGCVFFVTETDGVLTRDTIPPDCILTAVDTSEKNLPLYVAENKEATHEGEPGHIFRAKRDYEEAASSSSAPPPKQVASAPKAVASKKMPKVAPKPEVIVEEDVTMDLDEATRKGEPADAAGSAPEEEGDTTDAGEDEAFPLGSHPCAACSAVVANGMLFCLRCKAPQTSDSAKVIKRVYENSRLRQPILATAAAGAQKPIEELLTSDLRGIGDGPKKRGQMMSAEAAVIRDAKDRKQRSVRMNYASVSERFEGDDQFRMRMMQEGSRRTQPGGYAEVRLPRCSSAPRSGTLRRAAAPPRWSSLQHHRWRWWHSSCEARLLCPLRMEPLRTLRFIDNTADVPIGLTYMGAFLSPKLFSEIAAVNDAARRILTFDGEVRLNSTNAEGIAAELAQIMCDSRRSAEGQTRETERLADQNRQAAARNRPSQTGRGQAAEPMYLGYTQAQWDEHYRQQRRGQYTQAEWDAWNRRIMRAIYQKGDAKLRHLVQSHGAKRWAQRISGSKDVAQCGIYRQAHNEKVTIDELSQEAQSLLEELQKSSEGEKDDPDLEWRLNEKLVEVVDALAAADESGPGRLAPAEGLFALRDLLKKLGPQTTCTNSSWPRYKLARTAARGLQFYSRGMPSATSVATIRTERGSIDEERCTAFELEKAALLASDRPGTLAAA